MKLDLFKDCMQPVEKCLKDANMEKSDIHDIVLVGGSTRIPKVQELLQEFFNGKICKCINPDEAVAYGAAFHTASVTGACLSKNKDFVLMDVTPLSLGIALHSGNMSVVVPRNTTIPTKLTRTNYYSAIDHHTTCRFQVYEGERPMAKDNNFLGEFSLYGIPSAPKGAAKFHVHFDIDANGILTVSAELVGSNNRNQISITNHSGRLSKEEIDRMVKEAEKYKAQNEELKKTSQAKHALENYVDYMGEILTECGKRIIIKDRIIVRDAIEKTVQWLEWNCLLAGAHKFEKKMKELESICEPVITKMYQQQGSDSTCVKSEIIDGHCGG